MLEFLGSIVQLTEAHQSLTLNNYVYSNRCFSGGFYSVKCKLHYCVNFMTDCARNYASNIRLMELMLISEGAESFQQLNNKIMIKSSWSLKFSQKFSYYVLRFLINVVSSHNTLNNF